MAAAPAVPEARRTVPLAYAAAPPAPPPCLAPLPHPWLHSLVATNSPNPPRSVRERARLGRTPQERLDVHTGARAAEVRSVDLADPARRSTRSHLDFHSVACVCRHASRTSSVSRARKASSARARSNRITRASHRPQRHPEACASRTRACTSRMINSARERAREPARRARIGVEYHRALIDHHPSQSHLPTPRRRRAAASRIASSRASHHAPSTHDEHSRASRVVFERWRTSM